MRITIVSLDDPWERSHGGTLRTRSIVAACSALGHEVHVVYPGVLPADCARTDGVGYHPVAQRPVGERRLPPVVSRTKKALLPLPTMRGGFVGALADAVRAIGTSDVLGVSQLRATQYVEHAGPGARLWLDQSDLWSGFLGPEIAKRRGLAKLAAIGQRIHITRQETAWLGRAAAVTAAGYADTEAINARVGQRARWLPTPVTIPAEIPAAPARHAVGLLGNFAFWPNRDAYNLLRDRWLPELRREGVACVVAGYGSEALPPADGIELVGPVGAPSDFYALVSATVAPIRLGGGIKVKIAESLVYHRPVLATNCALEGFDPSTRVRLPAIDADRPDLGDFALRLKPDAELFDHARSTFSPQAFTATVEQTLAGFTS
jgi:hypothetical protein